LIKNKKTDYFLLYFYCVTSKITLNGYFLTWQINANPINKKTGAINYAGSIIKKILANFI